MVVTPRCCASVRVRGTGFFRTTRCQNLGKVLVNDVWYCGIHDPAFVKKRKEKVNAAAAVRRQQQRVEIHGASTLQRLRALLAASRAYRANRRDDRVTKLAAELDEAEREAQDHIAYLTKKE
jgi:hypothetical protein